MSEITRRCVNTLLDFETEDDTHIPQSPGMRAGLERIVSDAVKLAMKGDLPKDPGHGLLLSEDPE